MAWVLVLTCRRERAGDGRERVLHSFQGADGVNPGGGGLIFDTAGNLYGTSGGGGADGDGTVFELSHRTGRGWALKVLYSFQWYTDRTDGAAPEGGLIFDGSGNLYGTTVVGGTDFKGTVFELSGPSGWRMDGDGAA